MDIERPRIGIRLWMDGMILLGSSTAFGPTGMAGKGRRLIARGGQVDQTIGGFVHRSKDTSHCDLLHGIRFTAGLRSGCRGIGELEPVFAWIISIEEAPGTKPDQKLDGIPFKLLLEDGDILSMASSLGIQQQTNVCR